MRSSVIESDHTKTCRSTLFNCTDRQQLATDFAGSPRTVSPDEQWCKLISVRRTQFHVPLGTQTFQLPQSLQDIYRLLHTDAFTHRRFYIQTLVHTYPFTHKRFYTEAFTHRSFYTQKLLHTEAFTHRLLYTQTLLHTDAFTYRPFYTQTLLHTEAFTHRSFYTQKLLHTKAFTHKHFHTQKLLHTNTFTHRDRTREIAILPQFLTSNLHFACKGCP